MAKTYKTLPAFLRNWIDSNGDRNYGRDLDVLIARDAALVADVLKTPEAILESANRPYKQQMEIVPELSDEHSGFSFSQVVQLAIKQAKINQAGSS